MARVGGGRLGGRRRGRLRLGEPAAAGTMFIIHYEKTIPDMKGLYQFINMDFARSLPPEITLINREQDLGDPGLRQAKLTYRPCGYVTKFRVRRRPDATPPHA